jgi:hypothetical protein
MPHPHPKQGHEQATGKEEQEVEEEAHPAMNGNMHEYSTIHEIIQPCIPKLLNVTTWHVTYMTLTDCDLGCHMVSSKYKLQVEFYTFTPTKLFFTLGKTFHYF